MNEQEEQNEQQEIDGGKRVEAFLADPAVIAALNKLKSEYFAEFMQADGVDATMLVKAKVKVLEDFEMELTRVVHAGNVATIKRDRREKSPRPAGKR